MLQALIVLLLISLSLSVVLTPESLNASFYLLHTRAWEMLAGGLVYFLAFYYVPSSRAGFVFELLGFSLIAFSIFLLEVRVWPGYLAVLPVCGAVLILLAARQKSFLTNNIAAQKLGLWSYSIYLWHWPVIVGLVYIDYQNKIIFIFLGLFITLLLGKLSYSLVEKKSILFLKKIDNRIGFTIIAAFSLLVLVGSFYIKLNHGVLGRLSPAVELAASESLNINPLRFKCHIAKGEQFKSCIYGGANIKVILVGDSHASSLVSAIQASLTSQNDGVLAFTYSSCPTIFGVQLERKDLKCAEFNEWVLNEIRNQPSDLPLVIVNRLSAYVFGSHIESDSSYNKPLIFFDKLYASPTKYFLNQFKDKMIASTCEFAKLRRVYLIRPVPEMQVNVPKYVAKQLMLARDPEDFVSWKDYQKRNSFVWSIQDQASEKCGAKIVDITPSLCPNGICMGVFNNRPLYYDEHHLSLYGSSFLKIVTAN
jgi:hypothetical protein